MKPAEASLPSETEDGKSLFPGALLVTDARNFSPAFASIGPSANIGNFAALASSSSRLLRAVSREREEAANLVSSLAEAAANIPRSAVAKASAALATAEIWLQLAMRVCRPLVALRMNKSMPALMPLLNCSRE